MQTSEGVQPLDEDRHEVPAAARWLGAFGSLPFVALALTAAATDADIRTWVLSALSAYGAVILSFLGGIHWGLTIAGPGAEADGRFVWRLCASVLPSLVGWLGVLLPASTGLPLLAAGLAIMLWHDVMASSRGEAPAWYPALRWPLTVAAVSALLAATLM